MAAEIQQKQGMVTRAYCCFNEAAANGRGNDTGEVELPSYTRCFNEAAANGRGNRGEPRNAPFFAPLQ